jgi:tellurite resistance protein
MGVFDRKPKSISEVTLTPQEAMLGVILCISASDGDISKRELERMAEILSTHRMFNGQTESQIKAGLNKILAFMETDPVDQIVQKCAVALPQNQRIVAFALAVDIAMIDQNLHKGESAMLGLMASELGVEEGVMKTVVTILAMKNGLID